MVGRVLGLMPGLVLAPVVGLVLGEVLGSAPVCWTRSQGIEAREAERSPVGTSREASDDSSERRSASR